MSMHIEVDMGGVNALLQTIADDLSKATRPASQAAAQVLYDEVKRNVSRIGKVTGNLDRSIYQVYSKKNSTDWRSTYEVSWNKQEAPHGHLIERGHIQRYKVYIGKDGRWHTAVRADARGKPKPKRNASQSEKDAYYVALPVPKQRAAVPFMRSAISKFNDAMDAAKDKMIEAINKDYAR